MNIVNVYSVVHICILKNEFNIFSLENLIYMITLNTRNVICQTKILKVNYNV